MYIYLFCMYWNKKVKYVLNNIRKNIICFYNMLIIIDYIIIIGNCLEIICGIFFVCML